MSPRYPLERLAEVRAMTAAGAAIDLAAALRGEAEAEAAVAEAVAAVTAAQVAARAVALLDHGDGASPAPAWQVARQEAWATRLRRDVVRAQARLVQREAERGEWRGAVALAREQAVSARAEHQVVERHRERWEGAEKKKRERRED